jgi:hypothetical protein
LRTGKTRLRTKARSGRNVCIRLAGYNGGPAGAYPCFQRFDLDSCDAAKVYDTVLAELNALGARSVDDPDLMADALPRFLLHFDPAHIPVRVELTFPLRFSPRESLAVASATAIISHASRCQWNLQKTCFGKHAATRALFLRDLPRVWRWFLHILSRCADAVKINGEDLTGGGTELTEAFAIVIYGLVFPSWFPETNAEALPFAIALWNFVVHNIISYSNYVSLGGEPTGSYEIWPATILYHALESMSPQISETRSSGSGLQRTSELLRSVAGELAQTAVRHLAFGVQYTARHSTIASLKRAPIWRVINGCYAATKRAPIPRQQSGETGSGCQSVADGSL